MNELAFESFDNCMAVAKAILDERCYAVMITREEELWILNYVYADNADRNLVVFMAEEEFYSKYVGVEEEEFGQCSSSDS